MKSKKRPLLWMLAGGAALALGGLGIWLWQRHRAAQAAKAATPEEPQPEPEPEIRVVPPAPEVGSVDLSAVRRDHGEQAVEPMSEEPEPPHAEVEEEPPAERAPLCRPDDLDGDDFGDVEDLVRRHRPRRLWRRELEPEAGDEVVFLVEAGADGEWVQLEIVLATVEGVRGAELDVVPVGSLHPVAVSKQIRVDGYAVGEALTIHREHALLVIKAEAEAPRAVTAKNRRKRYRVQPGGLIELRPKAIPADGEWASSREDVEISVVEQDDGRAVLALDGPNGDVNVALTSAGNNGKRRPVASWKFKLAETSA